LSNRNSQAAFEVYSKGAINKEHVLKWCRSLKGGRTMCDCTPPPVHAHYLNSSSGKFLSKIHTVLTLHQVITSCFSASWNFLASHSEEGKRHVGLAEMHGVNIFQW